MSNEGKTKWELDALGNTVLRQRSAHLKELGEKILTEFATKKWPATLETDVGRVIK